MALGSGNEWEMIFVLSGLYGLRRNEVLGLRWSNVDLRNKRFAVVEQLQFKVPPGTATITEMALQNRTDQQYIRCILRSFWDELREVTGTLNTVRKNKVNP